ncbi:MAG: LCP family protein, partial [Acidimicrobiia bacterium]
MFFAGSAQRRAWLWRFSFALALTSVLTAGALAGGSWYLDHKLTRASELDLNLDAELPGATNFLLLGSDSRAFATTEEDQGSFGSTSEVGGQRADAIIVARVEPRSGDGLLVSFPRDLLVEHPGRSGLRRINEAFDKGPQGMIDVIRSNFGVPIHHYVELDFAGFRSMVDAIGGVRMYVPSPVRDRKTGLRVPEAGCVVFDGRQALAWVRSRAFTYLDGGRWRTDPTGDIGRIDRQQLFIRRLLSEAIAKGAFRPLRANRLADAALAHMKVDSEFGARDALRFVQAFRRVGPDAVEMIALPTRAASGGRLRPSAEAEAVLARLRGAGDASAVTPSSVRVRVLNGNGVAGIAGETSGQLTSAGFTVTQPGNAGERYSRTVIRHAPGARAKADFLARYLGGAGRLVADPAPGDVDVTLIVGADFAGVSQQPGPARQGARPAPPTTTKALP